MAKNKTQKMKRSTDAIINDSIAAQNAWMENRRTFARRFLHTLNIFARPSADERNASADRPVSRSDNAEHVSLWEYWFPILCAVLVILVAVWVVFWRGHTVTSNIVAPAVPEPVIQAVQQKSETTIPEFDIVRIEPNGNLVVAGRWRAQKNISIVVNGKIVATERTDNDGEFVYAPARPLTAGNYTISLIGADTDVRSHDKVFVYVSGNGYENTMSLLMTDNGSKLLQGPTALNDGDLNVAKIDYLSNGRIVVNGDALPRLRVSLALDGKYLGFARVSDHRHFGLGADVGDLTPGREYELTVRLHDASGKTVSRIVHKFVMPKMTGGSDTYYTVRRGDCLWIIAKNYMRDGVRFSMIANANNIKNPNLIYPKQRLRIPVKKGK